MRTYIPKDRDQINSAGFLVGTTQGAKKLYHEPSGSGVAIDMAGLRVTNDQYFSRQRGTNVLTEINDDDLIYLEDV